MTFAVAKNYTPLNDYPLTHYKQKRTILKQTCNVTGEEIPGFTLAWREYNDYMIRDDIHTEKFWVSDKGYMILKLRGHV